LATERQKILEQQAALVKQQQEFELQKQMMQQQMMQQQMMLQQQGQQMQLPDQGYSAPKGDQSMNRWGQQPAALYSGGTDIWSASASTGKGSPAWATTSQSTHQEQSEEQPRKGGKMLLSGLSHESILIAFYQVVNRGTLNIVKLNSKTSQLDTSYNYNAKYLR
jgi:hypothetical protein